MSIDENVFVRQATSKICGHLEIEVALWECLKYIKDVVSIERMSLAVWRPEIDSLNIIAQATEPKGEKLDIIVPISREGLVDIKAMQRRQEKSKWLDADIINDSKKVPALRAISRKLGLKDVPIMHMILETTGRLLCSLSVFAKKGVQFDKNHAHYLNLIKEPVSVAMSNALEHLEVLRLKEALIDDNRFLQQRLHKISGERIIGSEFGLKKVMNLVRQVASHDSPVLLLGETGVGKDVIANAIHYLSTRMDNPFITVNCGAIPDSLLDSELFGHEKGAFTGALAQKRGRFERANHGTIFLDEIGELPPQAQVRLLRVLQNREIERVGGTAQIPVNIRVLAATNRNLGDMVKSGQFRADLWFRLNVFPIQIPPLRERKNDIPDMLHHFIKTKSLELKLPSIPPLEPGSMDRLLAHDWPGNVRELANVVEHALIVSQGKPLRFDLIERSDPTSHPVQSITQDESLPTLDEMTADYLQKALDKAKGKIYGPGGAAELAGINSSTLRAKLKKLGVDYGKGNKSRYLKID